MNTNCYLTKKKQYVKPNAWIIYLKTQHKNNNTSNNKKSIQQTKKNYNKWKNRITQNYQDKSDGYYKHLCLLNQGTEVVDVDADADADVDADIDVDVDANKNKAIDLTTNNKVINLTTNNDGIDLTTDNDGIDLTFDNDGADHHVEIRSIPKRKLLKDRIRELTSEEIRNVNNVLTSSEENDEKIVIKKFNIPMTNKKIRCLYGENWLNDEVINFYMSMLQERNDALCLKYPNKLRSHFFSNFFMDRILENKEYNFKNVKKWAKKFDILKQDKIYFPLNIDKLHWVMIVAYMQQKKIIYYDSLRSNNEIINKKDEYFINNTNAILRYFVDQTNNKVDPSDWTVIFDNNSPRQGNGHDCGVFTILVADYLSDDLPLTFTQEQIPFFRQKITSTILRGSLDYRL
jgi:sentrin-specific protease 1